jgi:hypothetical protein
MLPHEFWHEEEKDDERVNIKCPRCGIFKPFKYGIRHRMVMFSGIIAQDAATDFRISDCVKSQHAGTSLFLHSNLALFYSQTGRASPLAI